MKTNQKGFSIIEILLVIAVVGLVGFVVWRVAGSQSEPETTNEEYQNQNPVAEESSDYKVGIVTFEDESKFPESTRDEIMSKVVNPFIDYGEHSKYEYTVTAVTVKQAPEQLNENDHQYVLSYSLEGGDGDYGFVFGDNQEINYWHPSGEYCGLEPCTFTDAYKAKYPEVYQAFVDSNNKSN